MSSYIDKLFTFTRIPPGEGHTVIVGQLVNILNSMHRQNDLNLNIVSHISQQVSVILAIHAMEMFTRCPYPMINASHPPGGILVNVNNILSI